MDCEGSRAVDQSTSLVESSPVLYVRADRQTGQTDLDGDGHARLGRGGGDAEARPLALQHLCAWRHAYIYVCETSWGVCLSVVQSSDLGTE